jgi:putative spermidine/putrescine transport system substrate-binding protein
MQMKPLSFIAVSAAVVALSTLPVHAEMPTAIGEGEGEVGIVAWPGYIERGETDKNYDWVTSFEKATGCKVNVKTAATSDEMVTLMNQGGFDLVTASGDASLRLVAGKKVQPVNVDLVPSWKTVDERLQNAPWHTVDGVHYGVPFQWGPNVLAYNTDVFKEPPKSWAVVFEGRISPTARATRAAFGPMTGDLHSRRSRLPHEKQTRARIKNPTAQPGPVCGSDCPAAGATSAHRPLLARCHGAGRRFQERGRRCLLLLAVPGQSPEHG